MTELDNLTGHYRGGSIVHILAKQSKLDQQYHKRKFGKRLSKEFSYQITTSPGNS